MTDITADATIAETYAKVEKLIWFLSHRFRRAYHLRYDMLEELFSVGNEVFMDVYLTYDSSRGTFEKRLSFMLWRQFINHFVQKPARERKRKGGPLVIMDMMNDPVNKSTPRFDSVEFLDELSEEARTIVKFIFDTPKELLSFMQDKSLGSISNNGQSAFDLQSFLAELGWTLEQIKSSFSEIKKFVPQLDGFISRARSLRREEVEYCLECQEKMLPDNSKFSSDAYYCQQCEAVV